MLHLQAARLSVETAAGSWTAGRLEAVTDSTPAKDHHPGWAVCGITLPSGAEAPACYRPSKTTTLCEATSQVT